MFIVVSLIIDCIFNIIIMLFVIVLIFVVWYSLRCLNLKILLIYRVIYLNLIGDIFVREKFFYFIKNFNWIWVNVVFCKWYLLEGVDINLSLYIKLWFGMFKGFIDVNVFWCLYELFL